MNQAPCPGPTVEPDTHVNGRPPEGVTLAAALAQLVALLPGLRAALESRGEPLRDRLLWSLNDISAATGMSRPTLERMRARGALPFADVKCRRRLYWKPATITAWIDGGCRR
jgi:hypothetical protein